MEDNNNKVYHCSTLDCNRTAQFYCTNHRNSLLCNGCATVLHSRCVINRIVYANELTENVGIIIDKVNNIEEYASIHGLHNIIENYDVLFRKTQEDAKELEKQSGQAIQEESYWRISLLNSQAKILK